jgi:hypothetical protein
MMKKRIQGLCIILLVLCSPYAQSQVSGYLGKRMNISYEFSLYPNYLLVDLIDVDVYSPEEGISYLYSSNALIFDYVVSEKVELSLKLSHAVSPKKNFYYIENNNSFLDSYYIEEFHDIKSMTYDIGCNIYVSDYVAPVGDFMRFSLFYANITDNTREVFETDLSRDISSSVPEKTKAGLIGFGFGYYHKRIIKDFFSLTFGCRMDLSSSFGSILYTEGYQTKVYSDGSASFNTMAYQREMKKYHGGYHGFIYFSIAAGLLPF